jgi:hypothetical protein
MDFIRIRRDIGAISGVSSGRRSYILNITGKATWRQTERRGRTGKALDRRVRWAEYTGKIKLVDHLEGGII